jgi:hypothetical protein
MELTFLKDIKWETANLISLVTSLAYKLPNLISLFGPFGFRLALIRWINAKAVSILIIAGQVRWRMRAVIIISRSLPSKIS